MTEQAVSPRTQGQWTPAMRDDMRRERLLSVVGLMPALPALSLIFAASMLAAGWQAGSSEILVAVMGAIGLLGAHTVHMARSRYRRSSGGTRGELANPIIVHAAFLGMLWGVVLNMIPVAADPAMQGVALVGAGALLVVATLVLAPYPPALLAFGLPLLLGVLGMGVSPDLALQGALLVALLLVVAAISHRQVRHLVRRQAEEAMGREKAEFIGLLLREFEQGQVDWIWGFSADGAINRMSSGLSAATGVAEDALAGADFLHFLSCLTPPNDPLIVHLQRDVAGQQMFTDIELRVAVGGRERWWSLTGKPTFNETGQYLGYLGTCTDVTERKAAEQRMALLSHHDALTGLLNRTKFSEQLQSCVARLDRYGTAFSLLFLDLDQFKSVNDNRGHKVGDRLLAEVARRLQSMVRESDIVARLGGDQFAIILPYDGNVDGASALAARVIETIRQPFDIDDTQISLGVSIGIVTAPLNGSQPHQLLRKADLALHRAKADGRSTFRAFENQMEPEGRDRRLTEADLREALRNDELVLHYQPVVAAHDEKPTGFEALIRWRHPSRGLVAPAEFIPLAEQTGLIAAIGDLTIQQACLAAATWPANLTVAVNISTHHFRRGDILASVQQALTLSGLAPQRLEIEITEGLLMENFDAVAETLGAIRALGVAVAIDDFGTGYSSLASLTRLAVDRVKIDRSFVDASCEDQAARDMLRSIAALGKTLGLKITAEGVETREKADFLSGIACHALQGFYFARPLDSLDLPHYLLTHMRPQAPALRAVAEAQLVGRS
jgi:diguanylate cyclase (GGDEF)-like protein/PAS domain S-box-containing protein